MFYEIIQTVRIYNCLYLNLFKPLTKLQTYNHTSPSIRWHLSLPISSTFLFLYHFFIYYFFVTFFFLIHLLSNFLLYSNSLFYVPLSLSVFISLLCSLPKRQTKEEESRHPKRSEAKGEIRKQIQFLCFLLGCDTAEGVEVTYKG